MALVRVQNLQKQIIHLQVKRGGKLASIPILAGKSVKVEESELGQNVYDYVKAGQIKIGS